MFLKVSDAKSKIDFVLVGATAEKTTFLTFKADFEFTTIIVLMAHRTKLHVLICVQVVDSTKQNSHTFDGSMTSFEALKTSFFRANRVFVAIAVENKFTI